MGFYGRCLSTATLWRGADWLVGPSGAGELWQESSRFHQRLRGLQRSNTAGANPRTPSEARLYCTGTRTTVTQGGAQLALQPGRPAGVVALAPSTVPEAPNVGSTVYPRCLLSAAQYIPTAAVRPPSSLWGSRDSFTFYTVTATAGCRYPSNSSHLCHSQGELLRPRVKNAASTYDRLAVI